MKHKKSLRAAGLIFTILQAVIVFAQAPAAAAQPGAPEKRTVFISREKDEKGARSEYRYMMAVGITPFIEEMKNLGSQGYRLEHVAIASQTGAVTNEPSPWKFKYMELAGVFKLNNPNTYEYDWFEAAVPGEIVSKITRPAESGFYYRDAVFASDDTKCSGDLFGGLLNTTLDMIDNIRAANCWAQGGIYFLERKNGEAGKREYRVHIGKLGWGKNPTENVQLAIEDTAKLGFRPVALGKMKKGMNYAFYAVVEKSGEGEPVKTQYKFFKSEMSFSKKVNAIAQEGYRIKFGGTFGALENVLLEKDEGAKPVSYKWVDASGKSHDQEMAAALSGGARFALVNREAEDLIFEDRPGEKYEYKILMMTPEVVKPSKKNPYPPSSKTQDEIFGEFDALLGEGYVIRDVFYSAGTKVLFERKK
jgi:hypothetical protein